MHTQISVSSQEWRAYLIRSITLNIHVGREPNENMTGKITVNKKEKDEDDSLYNDKILDYEQEK